MAWPQGEGLIMKTNWGIMSGSLERSNKVERPMAQVAIRPAARLPPRMFGAHMPIS